MDNLVIPDTPKTIINHGLFCEYQIFVTGFKRSVLLCLIQIDLETHPLCKGVCLKNKYVNAKQIKILCTLGLLLYMFILSELK